MDGDSVAFLGELLTYAGDWERGLALAGGPNNSIRIIRDGTGLPTFIMHIARATTGEH